MVFTIGAMAQAPTWTDLTATTQTCAPSCSTNMPGFKAWFQLSANYDPISQSILFYIGPPTPASGIYSTDIYAFQTTANKFVHIIGTGSTNDLCVPNPETDPGPPTDRHPEQTMVDTTRGLFWIVGGANATCGFNLNDQYYMILNSDPTLNTMVKVTPAGAYPNLPASFSSSMAYDSDNDVYLMWGATSGGAAQMIRYCPTLPVGGGTPSGSLSGTQTAAGCTVADGWTVDTTTGTGPVYAAFPGIVYSTSIHKAIIYGGNHNCPSGGCTSQNGVFTYSTSTKVFANPSPSSPPPALCWNTGSVICSSGNYACASCDPNPPMAWDSAANLLYLHQDTGVGSPADWVYDPNANTWTQVLTGSGPDGGLHIGNSMMGIDPSTHSLILYEANTLGGAASSRIWRGQLSGAVGGSVSTGTTTLSGKVTR